MHASGLRVGQNPIVSDIETYIPRVAGRRRDCDVRGVRYAMTEWGDANAPLLVYLHGWADTGSTFQFVVDALQDDWRVVAPDWRGFGRSTVTCTSYWFPDYVADLHELLEILTPREPVRLIGHSMGGNVAGLYAGTMPERVRAFANLEGFGLAETDPQDAPRRVRAWIEAARSPQAFSSYADFATLALRIHRRHPGMSQRQAAFVAREWGRACSDGHVELRADPRHKLPNPILYRRAEAAACWQQITADVMLVEGAQSDLASRYAALSGPAWPADRHEVIDGAGHMLHFEAPAALAAVLERFLRLHL